MYFSAGSARTVCILDHRNVLSPTYDSAISEKAVQAIGKCYSVAIDAVHGWFMVHRTD